MPGPATGFSLVLDSDRRHRWKPIDFGEAIKGWRMFPRLIDRYFNCGKIDTSVELKKHRHMKCEFTKIKIKLLYPEYETKLSMYDIFSKCFQISKKARRAPVQRLWCISRELFPPLQESDQMNMVCKVIDWRVSFINTYTQEQLIDSSFFFMNHANKKKKIFKKKTRFLQHESQLPVSMATSGLDDFFWASFEPRILDQSLSSHGFEEFWSCFLLTTQLGGKLLRFHAASVGPRWICSLP